MQTNEFVGQVDQSRRLPHVEQALTAKRVTPETRVKGMSADESRRRATRHPTRKPHRYGVGF